MALRSRWCGIIIMFEDCLIERSSAIIRLRFQVNLVSVKSDGRLQIGLAFYYVEVMIPYASAIGLRAPAQLLKVAMVVDGVHRNCGLF
jgi:hypothetical protein